MEQKQFATLSGLCRNRAFNEFIKAARGKEYLEVGVGYL